MEKLFIGCVLAATLVLSAAAALYPTAGMIVLALVCTAGFVALARNRVRRRIVARVADPRLAPELVLFPLLVSVRQSAVVTVGLLALLLFVMICRSRNEDARGAHLMPFVLLAFSAAIVFRTSLGMTTVIAVLAILFVWASTAKVPRAVALPSLVTGVSVYLIANVLGQLAKIPSPLKASRLGGFESSAGFFDERLVFPFARSINEPAVITAAYLALVAAMWMTGRKVGPVRWFGVLAGGYIMVGSNSRLPFIVAGLLVLATLLTPMLTRKLARPTVLVAGALPFYLPVALPAIAAIAGAVANINYLARGQSVEDIIGLGTRDRIWSGSVEYWNEAMRMDLSSRLFGFGVDGHVESGANSTYLRGLGDFLADKDNLTMHNSFLQQLFDGGLLGLALLAAALLVVLRRFAKDVSLLPQLVFVSVLGVGAASEIILAPGFTQTPFFLLLALAAFSPATPEATGASPHRSEPLTGRMLPAPLSR